MATSTIQFWISFNNESERLRLPVNPERLSVSSSQGYEDIEVNKLGEYTVFGGNKLREYSFSSFFPRDYNPSYCEYEDVPNPWDAVEAIERWKAAKRPLRLTITGTPVNVPVTVRSFNYGEEGGSPGDISFDITLKEYVFVEFTRIVTQNTAIDAVSVMEESLRPSTRETPDSYAVQSGDTLWKIAQQTYGDGDRWREIYDANSSLIGANPNLIQVGMTLVIT